ncbi:MAG: hypothetical protein R2706_11045 [Acidimicrobiales bacterium]
MHYTGCNLNLRDDCTRRGGEFQELERVGGRVYASCHCWADHMTDTTTIFHGDRPSGTFTGIVSTVVAYSPQSGQRIQSFQPMMSGENGAFAITGASDGCLWVAGDISTVGEGANQQPGRNLVRLCDALGAGADPSPNPTPPSPLSCTATLAGSTATVSWPALQTTGDLEAYVIERKVGNGSWAWLARVDTPGTSYNDTPPTGQAITYRVTARFANRFVSSPTTCQPTVIVGSATAPSSCTTSANGLAATISWTASPNATEYQVSRSVNGSPYYFRLNTTARSTTDTLRATGSHTYAVKARIGTTAWSAQTICAPALVTGAVSNAAPPVSCTASANGTAATITWPSAADATEHQILRSVDGSQDWWRGVIAGASYTDQLRASGVHVYRVLARNATGVWSAATTCAPALVTGAVSNAAPPVSCTASANGTAATITWPSAADATEHQILRSVDGSQDWWRGHVYNQTQFSDTLNPTGSHAYSVRARNATGVWSSPTPCSPAISASATGAPAWCTAVDAGANADLSWAPVNGATEYQILRSVNGSQDWWRWQGAATSVSDPLGVGSQSYRVRSRVGQNAWSPTTICTPTITR